jgi:hypothetical protein
MYKTHETDSETGENDLSPINDTQSSYRKPNMPLLALLQHFAVYTNQNHSDMTYLLMLLKLYEPEANYSILPNTGKELVKIDGFDWTLKDQQQSSPKLPPASPLGTGKYLHFGLENALSGESPGMVHRDADLFQFVNVYVDEPNLLLKAIVKRVRNILFKICSIV